MDILVKGFKSGSSTYGAMCSCDCNCNCNCIGACLSDIFFGDLECARKWGFNWCVDCSRYTPIG